MSKGAMQKDNLLMLPGTLPGLITIQLFALQALALRCFASPERRCDDTSAGIPANHPLEIEQTSRQRPSDQHKTVPWNSDTGLIVSVAPQKAANLLPSSKGLFFAQSCPA